MSTTLSSIAGRIPTWAHPALREVLVFALVMLVNLACIGAIRIVLIELALSGKFNDLAARYEFRRALWKLFKQRDASKTRIAHVADRGIALTPLLALAVAAGLAVSSAFRVQRVPKGFTIPPSPTLVWITALGYALGMLTTLVRGGDRVMNGKAILHELPLGFGGHRWIGRMNALSNRSQLAKPKANPVSFEVVWPQGAIDEATTRAMAIQAYRPHHGSMISALFFAVIAMWFGPSYEHDLTAAGIGYLCFFALVILGEELPHYLTPLHVRLQTGLLWCIQTKPPAELGGLQDPMGMLRAGLSNSRRRILTMARQLQGRARSVGMFPAALILRGVARDIEVLLEGEESLSGTLPAELVETLELTVAYVAGAKDPEALRKLARRVKAFDAATGQPDPKLIGNLLSPGRRLASRLNAGATVATTAARNVAVLFVLVAAIALLASGRLSFSSLPSYIK